MPILAPQPGKQEIALNAAGKKVDILVYGGAAGAGKSRLILLKAGMDAYNDPNYEAVLFRRTTPPLKAAGGLFTEAKKLFKPNPINAHVREKDLEIVFNKSGGGNLKFTHLEHESTPEDNHQGLQYSAIFFDELTHFTQSQFLYMIGRLRSQAAGNSYCMATTNPDMDSWVLKWVKWYLTEDGYFDESKLGKVLYFVINNEDPIFAETEEELVKEYPDLCWSEDNLGNPVFIPPMSFMFIGGTIFDNPALLKSNPRYLSSLKAQSKINRMRLLDGCWYARAEGSNYWDRRWLNSVDTLPSGCVLCRAWDKASAEPSDKYPSPDFTASIKMAKDKDGNYYILGSYDPATEDKKTGVLGKFRKRPGARDNLILNQAKMDGTDVKIVLPEDPGAGGRVEFREASKKLITEGFKVYKDPVPSNKSKLTRFEPFSAACQAGLVSVVKSTFDPITWEAICKELESFNGERSTTERKDDWADACASAFNFLASQKTIQPFAIPNYSAPTGLNKSH